jgi:hypothetical protein
MNETTYPETNTGDIDVIAHEAGMNVYVRRDFFGAMLVCAEYFTYVEDGWCEDAHTVAEITFYRPIDGPMEVTLCNNTANTAGPRIGWDSESI